MKFGKVIRKAMAVCPNDWQDYWMDYKSFKLMIAEIEKEKNQKEIAIKKDGKSDEDEQENVQTIDITSLETEKKFFQKLTESVHMVDNFFIKIQRQYILEVKELLKEVQNFKNCSSSQLKRLIMDLLDKCRVVHGKLLLLEMYAHVNYCGFTKITKKHDRLTGYTTQQKYLQKKVNIAVFSSFKLLRNTVRIVEDHYIILSNYLSDMYIPPISKCDDVKEVNQSLSEIDNKSETYI